MIRMVLGSGLGAVAGFLTRPCCVLPAAMSITGVGSAGLAHAAVAYRPVFMSISALMLVAALWITLRREGGFVTKTFAVCATVIGFVISVRLLEGF